MYRICMHNKSIISYLKNEMHHSLIALVVCYKAVAQKFQLQDFKFNSFSAGLKSGKTLDLLWLYVAWEKQQELKNLFTLLEYLLKRLCVYKSEVDACTQSRLRCINHNGLLSNHSRHLFRSLDLREYGCLYVRA